ncbi:hypothetical protein K431DRAFT_289864 [Polychaeton citri CBS 116435]|uniref:Uncharacterized protein n=1 Tax=Polychaeton citri CBS 116435 TaxID=1314669 RepID=A0A9P4PXZ7_9PEZI|nr:hypothetical protein K431DRAFT_289864 [Polychaeton citri CBS 116435]
MTGFAQTEPSLIDLTITNTSIDGQDPFRGVQNLLVDGPPKVLLDRIAYHLKRGCYKVVSLNIGGPISYRATCVAVISTTLSRTELRQRGFEWHGLDSTLVEDTSSPSEQELEQIENMVRSDTSTELVRIDFSNGSWKSSYNFIRGGFHSASIERALILVDEHIKKGCYRLEALFTVKDWVSVCIDTDLTQEELRAKGFIWHGLEPTEDEDPRHGAIVMPGWSRAEDCWEHDEGVMHYEAAGWRDF